jgi:glycosyltransferase involved in cell wall biosynthesis
MTSIRRVVVVSENLGGVLDEGIRKFATNLLDGFRAHGDAYGVATSSDNHTWHQMVKHVSTNKLFTGKALREELEELDPGLIVYIPSASATTFAFWRARMLKRYAPNARVAMVAVQPRYHSPLGRLLVSEMGPDKVFAQSRRTIQYMEWLGKAAQFVPSGVDLDQFRPVTPDDKRELREKYDLPPDDYLVLHVGHLKPGRNVELLAKCEDIATPILVCGASMGHDDGLRRGMTEPGVIVIDSYVREIEEIYQACDAYVFPTREEDSAMDFPLSVLEAMACNLPVVAYPFGGLPLAFEPGDGLVFVESDEAMISALDSVRRIPAATRAKAEPYTWENVAGRMLEVMEGMRDAEAYSRAV